MADQTSRLAIVIDSKDAEKRIKALQGNLRGLDGQSDSTGRHTDDLGRNMQGASTKAEGFGASLSKLSSVAKVAGLSIAAIGALTLRTAGNFEEAMNGIRAVSGAVGKDFDDLRELAKKLGSETAYSATEAANGMEDLAKAGLNTSQILTTVPSALNLASAGAIGLSESASILTAIMGGMSLKASDSARVADVLARAAASSAVDVTGLGEAMKFVGPVAATMGQSLEATTALIGSLGDKAIQSGQAGTVLRGLLLRFSNDDGAIKMLNQLGVSITESNGSFRNMIDVFGDLEVATKNLSPDSKVKAFNALGGTLGVTGLAGIIDSVANGSLDALKEKLDNAKGSAEEMAAIRMAGFVGSIKGLKSAIEGLQIAFSDIGALSFASNIITAFANGIRSLTSSIPKASEALSEFLSNAAVGTTVVLGAAIGALTIAWNTYASVVAGVIATSMAAVVSSLTTTGYWFTSNTLLINAQITSYFSLSAMIDRYNLAMMLAKLTVASYVDLAKTTALVVQAKATAFANAARAAAISTLAIVQNGQVTATLAGAARAATAAIVQKITAMRTAISTTNIYSGSLTVLSGTAAVTGTVIKGLGLALSRLGTLINTHPIIFLGGLLLSVVAATKDAEGEVRGLTGAMDSFGDAVKVVGDLLGSFMRFAIDGFVSLSSVIGTFITSFVNYSFEGTSASSNMFSQFFENTEGGFLGLLQVGASVADSIAVVIRSLIITIGRGMGNLANDVANKAAFMGNVLIDAFNDAATAITGVLNGILDGVSTAIEGLNKLPFVNISDNRTRYTAKQVGRLNASRAPDTTSFSDTFNAQSLIQKQSGLRNELDWAIYRVKVGAQEAAAVIDDSLMPSIDDLTGGMDNLGDAAGKAGKKGKAAGDKKAKASKKSKDAVDKERQAYEKLIETYQQQKASYDKMVWDLDASFATELHDLVFELEHASGKFLNLPNNLKQQLVDLAKSVDVLKVTAAGKGIFNDLIKEFELLGDVNPVKKMMYDLDDLTNVLSTLDGSLKLDILDAVSALDFKKHALDIAEMNKDIDKQLMLLRGATELDRKRLEIGYEHNEILNKFAYLQDVGHQSAYDSLKVDLDKLSAAKELLAVTISQNEASERLQSVMDGITQQSPMAKIQADYEANLEALDEFESQYTSLMGVHSADRLAIEQSYQDAKAQLMLSQSEAIFGALAGMSKGFLGEQSGLYRGLYAIQKAYTLSSALLSSKKAIMDAWADTPGGYFAKAFAAGKTILSTSAITSAIGDLAPKGFKAGGYTGNGGTNQVAGEVHGQEYVFDAKSTRDIGVGNLDAMRRGGKPKGGDSEVNITVNVDAQGNSSMSGDQGNAMGKQMANGIKGLVQDMLRKEKRQGGMLYG